MGSIYLYEPKQGQIPSAFATHIVIKDGIASVAELKTTVAQMVEWFSSNWKGPDLVQDPGVKLLKQDTEPESDPDAGHYYSQSLF